MTGSLLIAGCGDIGKRVAALCLAQGARVSALARSHERCAQLKALGITPVPGDLDDANSLAGLPAQRTHIYYFAPPPEGCTDPRMERFLQAITPKALPQKIVYISTSGVYGDCKGAWVTEDTTPHPQTARAQARHDAETRLLAWSCENSAPVVILRVGGIYGPGRFPIERIRRGEPVVRREEAPYTNRVHADDLARICIAAGARAGAGRIYNVCDDEHSTMTDYFNAVADALGLARPPQISLADAQKALSPSMLSYLNESRRMDNRRMREELGIVLRYPNLAEGLAGSIR